MSALGVLAARGALRRLAAERCSSMLRDVEKANPPKGKTAQYLDYWKTKGAARYNPAPLKDLIAELVGEDTYIGDLKQKVLVPAVNVTKSQHRKTRSSVGYGPLLKEPLSRFRLTCFPEDDLVASDSWFNRLYFRKLMRCEAEPVGSRSGLGKTVHDDNQPNIKR